MKLGRIRRLTYHEVILLFFDILSCLILVTLLLIIDLYSKYTIVMTYRAG